MAVGHPEPIYHARRGQRGHQPATPIAAFTFCEGRPRQRQAFDTAVACGDVALTGKRRLIAAAPKS